MKASEILARIESLNESAVKAFNPAKMTVQDMLVAFKNAGYIMNASDIAGINHIMYDKQKSRHVYGMVSYDDNDGLWLVNRVYVSLGKDSVVADSDGAPSFETDDKAEALKFLKTFK